MTVDFADPLLFISRCFVRLSIAKLWIVRWLFLVKHAYALNVVKRPFCREEREEAITSYEKLYDYIVGDDDTLELDYGEFMELNHYIRSALRPFSREQVEKVWREEWDYPTCEWNLPKCPKCGCNSKDATYGHKNNFCPRCGAPMTDEAVDMVMERLEALKDEKD